MAGDSIKTNQVLLIEDDSRTAQAIELTLEPEGFSTSVARYGEEGINRAKASAFDVILLDLTLPDMSGFDVLKRLQASNVRTPVLIISGTADGPAKAIAYGLSGYDYLPKPFSSADLINRIHANTQRPALGHLGVIKTGHLAIDLDSRRVMAGGVTMLLLPEEYEALALLAHQLGKVTSREELIYRLYPHETNRQKRVKEVDSLIIGLIMKLRAATGEADYLKRFDKRNYVLADYPVPEDMRDQEEGKVRSSIAEWSDTSAQAARQKSKKEQIVGAERPHKEQSAVLTRIREIIARHSKGQAEKNAQIESRSSTSLKMPLELTLKEAVSQFEQQYLKSQVASFGDDIGRMAEFIGLDETTLRRKLLFLEICCPDDQPDSRADEPDTLVYVQPNLKSDAIKFAETAIDLADIEHHEAIAFFTREYLSAQIRRFKGNMVSMAEFIGMKHTVLYRKLWYLGIDPPGSKEGTITCPRIKQSNVRGIEIDQDSKTVVFDQKTLALPQSEFVLLDHLCREESHSQPNEILQYLLYKDVNSSNARWVHFRVRMLSSLLSTATHRRLWIMENFNPMYGPIYTLHETNVRW